MFPWMVIAIGITVLAFGKRLAVLGGAVGALFGVGLLRLFPGSQDTWLALGLPILLGVLGFFAAGFAKGIVNIIVLAMGALGGAAIVLAFLNLFNLDFGWLDWGLAIVGAVVGLVLVRRFKDWGLIILAGLVGGFLVTRGLSFLFPALDSAIGTLLVLVFAGGGIAFQGGLFPRRQAERAAKNTASSPPSAPAGVPTTVPDSGMAAAASSMDTSSTSSDSMT